MTGNQEKMENAVYRANFWSKNGYSSGDFNSNKHNDYGTELLLLLFIAYFVFGAIVS
jgi:hypothetical protein